MTTKNKLYKIILSAMFLALAIVLPFVTGQVPKIGNALCPMHIPVILCGFFCGPVYGAAVGAIAPLLRFAMFGMPPIVPKGVSMCLELATYGLMCGILYRVLPKTKVNTYLSLFGGMLLGRLVWGLSRTMFYGFFKYDFGVRAFISGAFTTAIPGIILQIAVIPVAVMLLDKPKGR